MIVVIADDVSGATELANAAVHRGLSAELQTAFCDASQADVICLDSDTRGCSPDAAARRVAQITLRVLACRPAWIYKKCDSVLRGNVLAELRAMAEAGRYCRAVLIPANPSRGRMIREGCYFIGNEPLEATAFAQDPEHPRWTSDVRKLLVGDDPESRAERAGLLLLRTDQDLSHSGIAIPDATSWADLEFRAAQVDSATLPAGGVEFFDALLAAQKFTPATVTTCSDPRVSLQETARAAVVPSACDVPPTADEPTRALFVCGSAAAWLGARRRQCAAHGVAVVPMPAALFAARYDENCGETWAEGIGSVLASGRDVMASIGDAARPEVSPSELIARLVRVVRRLLEQQSLSRLCVEGGATAAALLRELGWTRLTVSQPCAPGVGALRPLASAAPVLFIKPGSYDWPEEIWRGG